MRVLWLMVPFAFGCAVEETKTDQQTSSLAVATPEPQPTLATAYVMHDEPELGLRFPLAVKGTTFKLWNFDSTFPPEKIRHEIRLSKSSGLALVIDVWDNPRHLDVRHWVSATIDDLFDEQTTRSERLMSRANKTGIVFEVPAVEGGSSEAIAAYVTQDRAYMFVCLHAVEDSNARAMFDKIVNEFDVEVSP
jgi:hypothetical protein